MKYSIQFICLFILCSSVVAGDVEQGRLKAQACLGCHGIPSYTNVYPSYRVPKLSGQHADYIVAALKAYQSGERSHPTMRANASTLNATDMQDIAAYLAGDQKVVSTAPTVQASGELQSKLAICAGCHSMDGNSQLPQNPRLAGQYRDYLYQSLLDYKEGRRNNAIMLGIIATLNETDMKLLSEYFSKQQGLSAYHIDRRAVKAE